MANYKKIIVTTNVYNVTDMVSGTTPICDTKVLSGSNWTFTASELPATVYYETTATPKTTSLLFSTDSEHVTTRAGHNVEEELDSFRKLMAKEFTADASGKIEVNNGVEKSKVLGATIKGNTVKNYCDSLNPKDMGSAFTKTFDGQKYIITFDNSNSGLGLYFELIGLKPNQEYTFPSYEKSLSSGDFSLRIVNDISKDTYTYEITNRKFTIPSTYNGMDRLFLQAVTRSSGDTKTSGTVILSNVSVLDSPLLPYSTLQFGLNSTQAILTNNNQEYVIYEPTITGKTEILRALKGTQNWEVISADSERDTTKYDYKLESINGELGSVPSAEDYIDLASGVKYGNAKEVMLDGNASVEKGNFNGEFLGFWIRGLDGDRLNGTVLSDRFKSEIDMYGISGEGISQRIAGILIRINVSKLTTQDENGLKQWLQANPVTIRYQLATPTTTQLTAEELKAYDPYKRVISLPFAEDSVTIDETGSATWVDASDEYTITGNETITLVSDSSVNTNRFKIAITNNMVASSAKPRTYNAMFKDVVISDIQNIDDEGFTVYSSTSFDVRVLKTKASSVEEFKNVIKGLVVKFLNGTPTVTTLNKSIVPTIPVDKTNILTVGGSVGASEFKAVVPVDRVAEQQVEIDQIKQQLATTASLLNDMALNNK